MATVLVFNMKLVDLYANQGNADPLVVAYAIDGQRKSDDGLFGSAWVVVSGDKAVQAKAAELDVEVKTNVEFIGILKGESSQEARQS
jgi:hypothetical protein